MPRRIYSPVELEFERKIIIKRHFIALYGEGYVE